MVYLYFIFKNITINKIVCTIKKIGLFIFAHHTSMFNIKIQLVKHFIFYPTSKTPKTCIYKIVRKPEN